MATSHWKSALRGAEEKESPYLAAYDFFDQAGTITSRTLTIKGFAAEVLKTLREIRGEVAEVRGGLGELRNDVRGNTGAIVGHLGDHARGGTGQLDRPAPPEDPSPGKRKRGRRRPR